MIRVFYGEDRVRIQDDIRRIFEEDYELIEAERAGFDEIISAFIGVSLFNAKRKIVIRDLMKNSENLEMLRIRIKDLVDKNEVILWEEKVDKRLKVIKELEKAGVEFKEYKVVDIRSEQNAKMVFDILEVALSDGERAVKMYEEIEQIQDPYMLVGLFVSQALKKYSLKQGNKEVRLLQELAKLDINMKSSGLEAPLLIKSFLLIISQF